MRIFAGVPRSGSVRR